MVNYQELLSFFKEMVFIIAEIQTDHGFLPSHCTPDAMFTVSKLGNLVTTRIGHHKRTKLNQTTARDNEQFCINKHKKTSHRKFNPLSNTCLKYKFLDGCCKALSRKRKVTIIQFFELIMMISCQLLNEHRQYTVVSFTSGEP